jgi:hypothetical protein
MRVTPIQHFKRDDPRNLRAANARVAELTTAEGKGIGTRAQPVRVTAPEDLASWEWFNPRRRRRISQHSKLQLLDGIFRIGKEAPLSQVATEVVGLRAGGCRFPDGELADENFHFCNAQRREGSSYCERHAAVCRAGRVR